MTTMTAPATDVRRLHFVEPLPGFADEAEYTLEPIDPRGLLFSLRSVRDPGLRFVLAPAAAFFPDYRPELADSLAADLGGADVDVLVVLTIATGLADATANLRAPVVVCPATGRALQVVLDDESLPMRRPLAPR